MTKTLSTLLLTILSLGSMAQSYQPIQVGFKRYFINSGGYLRGMRVDSVVQQGNLTIYYPFRTPRGHYTQQQNLNTNGGSWLGQTILKLPDGTLLFDNLWQDTIVIKPHALLNESWIMYDDQSSVYYTATITAIDTITVLGVLDSIKRITISAYENLQVLTTDSMNDAEIILSQNHGFAQIFDLYTFPFHEPGIAYQQGFDYLLDHVGPPTSQSQTFKLIEFNEPTLLQIFNFEEGDVFGKQAFGSFGIPSWWTDSIVSKAIINSSQVEYIIQTNKKAVQTNNTISYTSTVYTEIVSDDLLFTLTKMPEEWGCSKFYYYTPNNTDQCHQSPIYTIKDNFIGTDAIVHSYGQCGLTEVYKEGFGKTFYLNCFSLDPGDSESDWMIYSFKNGQPCGSPPQVVSVEDTKSRSSKIDIYPTPADDAVFIKNNIPNELLQLTLLNIQGQVVLSTTTENSLERIPISDLPAGLYNLRIKAPAGEILNRKVLIQH